jgi:hypothetical protein
VLLSINSLTVKLLGVAVGVGVLVGVVVGAGVGIAKETAVALFTLNEGKFPLLEVVTVTN